MLRECLVRLVFLDKVEGRMGKTLFLGCRTLRYRPKVTGIRTFNPDDLTGVFWDVEPCGTNWCFEESEDIRLQSTSHVALCGVGVMEESNLKRNSTLFAQIERLQLPVGGPVPDMEGAAILTWETNSCE